MIWLLIIGALITIAGFVLVNRAPVPPVAYLGTCVFGLGVILMLIALVWFAISIALAHDHTRPELNDWFNKLQSGKGLCCSNNDGTALSDVDWETRDGHYRVYLDGEWLTVPDDAVITEPNRSGKTMVWPMKGYMGTSIRCFMPGSMT